MLLALVALDETDFAGLEREVLLCSPWKFLDYPEPVKNLWRLPSLRMMCCCFYGLVLSVPLSLGAPRRCLGFDETRHHSCQTLGR
jgi:hypothetical protein